MIDILAEVEKDTVHRGPSCSVGKLITDGKVNADELRAATDASGERAARALREHGIQMLGQTLKRHFNGVCRCDS